MKKIKVWDGGVRLFHWMLAALFCLSAYSAFQDKFGVYADIHFYAGFSLLILVSWRILWGIFGSDTARFSHFVRGPGATISYLSSMLKARDYKAVGHNPVGALSVVLILALLLVQAIFGLYSTDDMFFSGPLANSVGSGLSGDLTGWHKIFGKILIGVAVLHVLVVLWYQIARKVNLIKPMITGSKTVEDGTPAPRMRPGWVSVILLLGAGAGVCLMVF